MKKIEDFLNDRLPHAGLLPHSLMHSVAPLVLGLFVACLVTLSCNTSDVLIESFESLLLFDLLFMILSRYSFQYVVFKVRGTPQAKLLSANGDGEIRTLDPLLARQVLSQLSYTPAFSRFGFRCPLCFEDLRDEPAGPSKLNNTETCFPVQCHLDQLNHTV